MFNELEYIKRARFYSSVIMLYMVTLLFAWYLMNPYGFFKQAQRPLVYRVNIDRLLASEPSNKKVISGKPVRIVLGTVNIDLPVDEGYYDESNQTWTLSEKRAYFAMPSVFANNVRGNTFIYGHYNIYVFYHLKKIQPGDLATVYTGNGHEFIYSFTSSEELHPNNVAIFDYDSFPVLTVQTCSGNFYEYRQLFHFSLKKVNGQDV